MATTNVQKFAGNVDVGGTVTGDGSGLTTLNGSQVTTGTVAAARIASLDASKITTGSLGADRIPNLDAAKITTGNITRPVDTTGDVSAETMYVADHLAHKGDTNTKIGFPSNDTIEMRTASTERLVVTSTGNVGINDANPYNKLTVVGSTTIGAGAATNNATYHSGMLNVIGGGTRAKIHIENNNSVGAPAIIFGEGGNVTEDSTATIKKTQGGNTLCLTGCNVSMGWSGNTNHRLYVNQGAGGLGYGWRAYVAVYDGGGNNYERWFARNQRSWSQVGIYATQHISTGAYFILNSDERIKKDITDIDDGEALLKLRSLQPKKYKYIDPTKGTNQVFGFIAQEVSNVLPDAVPLGTEFIPNINDTAVVSDSNIITFDHFNTSNLVSNAVTIKIIDLSQTGDFYANIVDIINESSIRVDKDLTGMGVIRVDDDSDELEYGGSNIFVYGQEVNDFHRLNKDAIWTVASAALQEVDRIQQADQIRITTLEEQVSNLFARVNTLESA